MDIVIAICIFGLSVFVATLIKLELIDKGIPLYIINTAYITFILIVILMLFGHFDISINNITIFMIITFLAIIIVLQSTFEDVVAYTIAGLTGMYGMNNLIKAGDIMGQVMSMDVLSILLENHHTKTRIRVPHGALYKMNVYKL